MSSIPHSVPDLDLHNLHDLHDLHDLFGGGIYRWRGWHNYVDHTPGRGQAHVFAVRPVSAAGQESDVAS